MNAVPPIVTLTANLLAERTLEFDSWSPGKTQRAHRESFQVGGKGINVSKMLNRLGAPNIALCFTGGASGVECETWLRSADFAFHAFPAGRSTRTGTVVRAPAVRETTFFGVDAPPSAAALRACAEHLGALPTGTVLAVCGSLPGWESRDYDVLRDALHRWPERGPLVADTYGPPLAWFAGEGAALIRVNRTELESLFTAAERKLSSGELLRTARDRWAALRWVVSDGAAPVWFMGDNRDAETIPAPRVAEVSATGSGDVMLACTLFARFHRGLSWRDAVAWALPFAAANAAHPGVADFPLPLPDIFALPKSN
jgi:fructose-1-phosphate kinase PfkB-like protein